MNARALMAAAGGAALARLVVLPYIAKRRADELYTPVDGDEVAPAFIVQHKNYIADQVAEWGTRVLIGGAVAGWILWRAL